MVKLLQLAPIPREHSRLLAAAVDDLTSLVSVKTACQQSCQEHYFANIMILYHASN